MIGKSLYSQLIKNESKKINTIIGACCAFDPCYNKNNFSEEDIANMELLRNILTDNGNCDDVLNICESKKDKHCHKHKIEHDKYYTPTNIYRFNNQSFLDNYLGRSNINVTYLNKIQEEKREKTERILEKYNKCKRRGKCR